MHRTLKRSLLVLAALGLPAAASAQLEIPWFTIDGGGEMFTMGAGGLEISATIGQPDAGVMSGGSFTIIGGFWGGAPPCPADLDGDFDTDLDDLTILLQNFQGSGVPSPGGDIDGDDDTDLDDLTLLLQAFGQVCV
jgi:hypothetical protein